MAIAASSLVIVWSEQILERLRQRLRLRSLVRDHSAELGGRESMRLTDLKRDVSLNARTGTDQNYEAFGTPNQSDAQSITLTADQHYGISEAVNWLDEAEAPGNLMAQAQIWTTYAIEQQIQGFLRTTLRGATPSATLTISGYKDGSSTSGSAGLHWGEDGFAQRILNALLDLKVDCDTAGWPEMGRTFVTAPAVIGQIERYLRDRGRDFGVGFAADALTGVPRPVVHGWTMHPDPGILGTRTGGSGTLTGNYRSQALLAGETIRFAMQMQRMRTIPDPTAPQQLIQGLLKYGAVIPSLGASSTAEYLYEMNFQFLA